MNNANTIARQALVAALAGSTFAIGGVEFKMFAPNNPRQDPLTAVQVVRLHNGELHPHSDAVQIDDEWYPLSECVETTDGTFALEGQCRRIYNGWAHPHSIYARFEWFTSDQLDEASENGEVEYADQRGEYYTADDCVYTEHGEHQHSDDCVCINGDYYLQDSDEVSIDGHGDYFLNSDDDWVYCESDNESWPRDECHYCENSAEYIHCDEDDCSSCGNDGSDRINRYHHSPSPYMHRGFSGWLVGFEVEKKSVGGNDDEGESVEATNLFAGWECDSSCGVEGITNCYDPLDPVTCNLFRTHVSEAEDYLNEPTDKTCGGHINISKAGTDSDELFCYFRNYAPLWYAAFRKRLQNTYCNGNKPLHASCDKYVPVNRKSFGIEIRIPARVQSSGILLRRFDWVGVTCQAIDDRLSFASYLKACKPIMLAAYGDRQKVAYIYRLARHFSKWMDNRSVVHPSIASYI